MVQVVIFAEQYQDLTVFSKGTKTAVSDQVPS